MKRAGDVLAGVWTALKPGGRFLGEFGGEGNVAAVVGALRRALSPTASRTPVRIPYIFTVLLAPLLGIGAPHVTEWLTRAVQPGMTVAVIGAHVGVHVVYLGRLVGETGRVYAFEPWPANHAELLSNLELNAMRHVVAMRLALSDRTGVALMVPGVTSGTHALAMDGAGNGKTSVHVSTLDSTLKLASTSCWSTRKGTRSTC